MYTHDHNTHTNLFTETVILQKLGIVTEVLLVLPAAITRVHMCVVVKDLKHPLVLHDIVRPCIGWVV